MWGCNVSNNLLVVNKLNKSAGKFHILRDVSFSIPKGAVCAFIGPNGAGKTTTIKSIMGLYKYDAGDILVNGQSTKKYKVRRYIGYIPEKENFPKISGRNFMLDMADLHNIDKTVANKRIN
jgi:ABC-2 type transport system ATP-binding protein